MENTYSDYENEKAEITVYYAVKGDLIAFSPTSVEEAKSNAETEYDKIFSFVFLMTNCKGVASRGTLLPFDYGQICNFVV